MYSNIIPPKTPPSYVKYEQKNGSTSNRLIAQNQEGTGENDNKKQDPPGSSRREFRRNEIDEKYTPEKYIYVDTLNKQAQA